MDGRDPTGDRSDAGRTPSVDADTIIEGQTAAPEPDGSEPLTPGMRMGRYVVLEEIGSGGMGMVFAAYDPELNRKVALKLLRPERRTSKGTKSRLLQEAQALAKLAHPNVITVYDVGTFGDRVFVAMELVEGQTLTAWAKDKPRKWYDVLEVFIPAGRGLAAAHDADLVHRDFKPDNVLIGRDGRVRVMDFGLARPMRDLERADLTDAEADDAQEPAPADVSAPMLTQTGSIMGTPAYMAPEQHLGRPTDARSDQYSFCIALFQALYGERPFDGQDAAALTQQKLAGTLAEPGGRRVPTWIRRILQRGLAAEPDARFESMEAMLDELGKDPRAARRKWLTLASAGLVVVGTAFAVQKIRNARPTICDGAEAHLEGVWDEPKKAAAQAGVTAVSRPFAEQTYQLTAAALDGYTTDWVAMRTEACEATNLRGEQSARLLDLRNACLDDNLTEVLTVVETLAEADEVVVDKAVVAALSLSPLSRCADSEALATAAVDPPTEGTEAAVAEIRKNLARARALAWLGHTEPGLGAAEGAFEASKAVDYAPVLAEAMHRLGQVQGMVGAGAQAETNLSEAAWKAASVKHDTIAAAAAGDLVAVLGRQLGRHEEGLSWGRHAEAAIKRIGLGGFQEAKLRANQAAILAVGGEVDKAREAYESALQIFERLPRSGLWLAEIHQGLGDLDARAGQFKDARAHYEQAIEIANETVGAAHPVAAKTLLGPARLALARNEPAKAVDIAKQALALCEVAVGSSHPDLQPMLSAMGTGQLAAGQHDEALASFRRAHQIVSDALGSAPVVATALSELGDALAVAGRADEARTHHERAVRMWEETRDKDDPALTGSLLALAEIDGAGEPPKAVEYLDRALKIREDKGVAPRTVAETQFRLARALGIAGSDPGRARKLAESARKTFETLQPPAAEQVVEINQWLAKAPPAPDEF